MGCSPRLQTATASFPCAPVRNCRALLYRSRFVGWQRNSSYSRGCAAHCRLRPVTMVGPAVARRNLEEPRSPQYNAARSPGAHLRFWIALAKAHRSPCPADTVLGVHRDSKREGESGPPDQRTADTDSNLEACRTSVTPRACLVRADRQERRFNSAARSGQQSTRYHLDPSPTPFGCKHIRFIEPSHRPCGSNSRLTTPDRSCGNASDVVGPAPYTPLRQINDSKDRSSRNRSTSIGGPSRCTSGATARLE